MASARPRGGANEETRMRRGGEVDGDLAIKTKKLRRRESDGCRQLGLGG